jgi:hypothetical protein
MYERASTFNEYVKEYGLSRTEGVLLRYLSDAYKGLVQTVPENAKTEELYDVTDWLGAVVRQVDSSLLDEWEALRDPAKAIEEAERDERPELHDITADRRAFTVLLRNELFRFVQHLARARYDRAAEMLDNGEDWPAERLVDALAPYLADYQTIRTDPRARAAIHTRVEHDEEQWKVEQALVDPEENLDWYLSVRVDIDRSRAEQRPVLALEAIAS